MFSQIRQLYHAVTAIVCAPLLFFSSSAIAMNDPCDFSSGVGFLPEQVLACYHQVPVVPGTAEHMADALLYSDDTSSLTRLYAKSGFPLFMRGDFREISDRIRQSNFSGDFELEQFIQKEIFKVKNTGHVRFEINQCYSRLQPIIPLVISSKLEKTRFGQRQILYVKDNYILPNEYEAVTGINTDDLVGQKIVSIDGVPALEAFKAYVRKNEASHSILSNRVANVMVRKTYSLLDITRDRLPSASELNRTYIFEDAQGNRTSVDLPWVFLPRETVFGPESIGGYPATLASNTNEFIAQCSIPWNIFDYFIFAANVDALDLNALFTVMSPKIDIDKPQDKIQKHALKKMQHHSKHAQKKQWQMQHQHQPLPFSIIEDTTGSGGAILYGVLGDKSTVIKIESFSPDDSNLFLSALINGIDHACQNSDNLILDFSTNGGGSASLATYTLGLLALEYQDGFAQKFQDRFPDPVKAPFQAQRLFGVDDVLGSIFGGCELGFEPQCILDENLNPLTAWANIGIDANVKRGKERIDLTELLVFSPFLEGNLPAPIPSLCQGKFQGNNLILLMDGANASAATLAPAALRHIGTTVGYNGLYQYPQYIGFAYGGSVEDFHLLHSTLFADLMRLFLPAPIVFVADLIELALLPTSPVRLDYRWERPLAIIDPIVPESKKLLIDQVLNVDIRLPLWDNDDLASLYTETLRAVKQQRRHHHHD